MHFSDGGENIQAYGLYGPIIRLRPHEITLCALYHSCITGRAPSIVVAPTLSRDGGNHSITFFYVESDQTIY